MNECGYAVRTQMMNEWDLSGDESNAKKKKRGGDDADDDVQPRNEVDTRSV